MGGWGPESSGSEEESPPLVHDLGWSPVPRPLPRTGPGGSSCARSLHNSFGIGADGVWEGQPQELLCWTGLAKGHWQNSALLCVGGLGAGRWPSSMAEMLVSWRCLYWNFPCSGKGPGTVQGSK